MPDYESVDAYLKAQEKPVAAALAKVRAAIRKALPKAEETVSYKIPTYKLGGKAVIFFAAWKKHWSLYPVSESLLEKLGEDAKGFDVEKGTIRFAYDDVPVGLIGRLAKLRAGELADEAKPAAKKSTSKRGA